MADKLILNTAHPAGRTFLAFSRDGRFAYTGGCDSLVRVWKTEAGTDQEPDTALEADEPITALASDNDGWLSGSDDSHVRRYLKANTEMESLITRTNGVPIRFIAADPKGRKVAITSDDLVVKVVELDDTTKIKLLSGGHKKGVRSATWHPSGNLLTTCGSDGRIVAWDLTEEEPKIEKTLDAIIPVVADSESNEFGNECAALWHNSGLYFIVATAAHEIATISRNTWSQVSTFSDPDCLGAVTALALSVNGVYLASACKAGIFVWSTATRRVVARQSLPTDITVHKLAFSPAHNLLAWTDSSGNLTRWPDVIPPSAPSPIKAAPSGGMTVPARRRATPLFGQDEDADNVDAGGNDTAEADLLERDDDWIIDDEEGAMEDRGEKEYGLREMVSVTKAQPAFQPGSTPFQNKRRYLSFNNIGVVEVVDQDTHHIVNIEFHDQTTRKNYHFSDHFKFDMAAVGERGVVYACSPENDHPAQITYKPYSTWATHGEWTYSLPKGERVTAVAAGGTPPTRSLRRLQDADAEGNGYVAVATTTGEIRFFSGGGIQRGPVWAVDGDIIAMVAGKDYVFVVHREGGTSLDGNQNIKYTLRTSDTYRVMHTGRLPVNKGNMLKWIGITDEGAPVIYDSTERIMMLEHFRFTAQGSWVVLLNAKGLTRRVGKDESYWPIGVTKSTLMCIILKGREEFPGFPRPLAQEIDMQMPYYDMDSSEAQKEERLSRETIMLDHLRDAMDEDILTTEDISKTELDLDKEIIQIIQLACKHDKLQRAIDAAKLLHHTASFDLAIKVADFYHLAGLREKINVLKLVRQETDRLRDARDGRKDWRRAAGPIPPSHDIYAGCANCASNPLQNTAPPPAIHRPRLTAATPSSEPSPFSRKPVQQPSVDISRPVDEYSPPPEKRKRDEGEEASVSSSGNSKRRAMDDNPSRPTKANPFAKKPADKEGTAENKSNPFLRKLGSNKSLHKSDSFFEKVNAAESEAEKGKHGFPKSKKAQLSKQTTLFGLPPGSDPKKPIKGSKSKKTPHGDDDAQSGRETSVAVESQETNDDTQFNEDESALSAEVSQSETQEVTQTEETIETQLVDEVNDEISMDWPATPPPISRALEAEA